MSVTIKSSGIDLNIPAKVIPATASSLSAVEYWIHDDNEGDKWWIGGSNPKPYRWELTLQVSAIEHGSHKTREPFKFNGLDIHVGDFIGGSTDGKVVQIISIASKTETECVCIVEDLLRYNTFRNPSGSGIFNVPGQVVIFQLNEFGEPMIDPLPLGVVSEDFFPNINSRFKYLNLKSNYVLEQKNHGFEENDVIAIGDDGNFELTNSTNLKKIVGTISHAGPGPDYFMLRPMNGVIDLVPALPGSAGEFVYASTDGTGDMTLDETGAPVFLTLRSAIPTVLVGSVINATTTPGSVLEINDELVTMTGTTITDAVNDINAGTAVHGVSASSELSVNVASSDVPTNGSAYGLVGGFPPFSASINGVTVNFSTTTAGQTKFNQAVAIAEDLALDINNSGIPNLMAKAINDLLYLYEETGGAITIVNVTNDTNNNPFAGANSITSLSLSYPASTGSTIVLTRSDGGEVLLRNITGTPAEDFGIVSGHNGSYPIGLNIEHGLRDTKTTVVPNIPARDALPPPLVGDQVYVIDTGEGEWGMYLWDGSQWMVIATEDSAATDANSLSHTFTLPLGVDPESILMGRISDNSRVVSVMVEVSTPLAGYTTLPSISIGTLADPTLLANDDLIDLTSQGSYSVTPDFYYAGTSELELYCVLTHYGSTSGEIKVTISYV